MSFVKTFKQIISYILVKKMHFKGFFGGFFKNNISKIVDESRLFLCYLLNLKYFFYQK